MNSKQMFACVQTRYFNMEVTNMFRRGQLWCFFYDQIRQELDNTLDHNIKIIMDDMNAKPKVQCR